MLDSGEGTRGKQLIHRFIHDEIDSYYDTMTIHDEIDSLLLNADDDWDYFLRVAE